MLRIAKSTPGVLDLSAVKDEFGLPVTLNGASHRDVPDHEEDNPVLQRVRDMKWVTVTRMSVKSPDDPAPQAPDDPAPQAPATMIEIDKGEPPAETTTSGEISSEAPLSDGVDQPPVDSADPPTDVIDDTVVKTDPSNRASGRPDTRKAGRRS